MLYLKKSHPLDKHQTVTPEGLHSKNTRIQPFLLSAASTNMQLGPYEDTSYSFFTASVHRWMLVYIKSG